MPVSSKVYNSQKFHDSINYKKPLLMLEKKRFWFNFPHFAWANGFATYISISQSVLWSVHSWVYYNIVFLFEKNLIFWLQHSTIFSTPTAYIYTCKNTLHYTLYGTSSLFASDTDRWTPNNVCRLLLLLAIYIWGILRIFLR